jgi:hypothetical protein
MAINKSAAAAVAIFLMSMVGSGCSSNNNETPVQPVSDIPTGALEVKSGAGRMFFQTMNSGTLYVYDASTASVVFFAPIEEQQRFLLEPDRSRATIEGKAVYEQPIDRHHIHRLYLLVGKMIHPATAPAPGPVLSPTTHPAEETPSNQ